MPSHAKNVKPFRDTLPIFSRFGIENQLDAMFQPVVQLRSGGYIVINQTEALVAIDVNSGRATREHHIEDTALKTNLEASEEIARQLRLRDLAGLVVIDFIDMDEKRNNRTVERRLKEALKQDRARIQVGHISHFGLLEMSRQRIRSSVLEASTDKCPHCGGTGHVRSVSSVSLQLLRAIEEMLLKGATHNIIVRTRTEIALYLLNHKRAHLRTLEERFHITITVNADATIAGQVSYVVEKGEQVHSLEQAKAIAAQPIAAVPIVDDETEDSTEEEEEAVVVDDETESIETEAGEQPLEVRPEREGRGRRRRRRGRGGEPRENREASPLHDTVPEHAVVHADDDNVIPDEGFAPGDTAQELGGGSAEAGGDGRRRRRGRRGGRRNRRGRNGEGPRMPSDAVAEFETEVGADWAAGAPADEPTYAQPDHAQPEPGQPAPEQPDADRRLHRENAPAPVAFEPPAPPAAAAPPTSEVEPVPQVAAPRRRSTVREPAPVASSGEPIAPPIPAAPVELPQPVVSESTASNGTEQPRRSGWWRKR
jgi:ribonuclease E